MDVLAICTGNQCRSPMAEALFRDRMARAGVEGTVSSAGLMTEGVPAAEASVRAMERRGLDLSAHRSTPLTEDAVAAADLVVGMTREHVREVVVMVADAFERSWPLRDLVRRAEATGPRRVGGEGEGDEDETFAEWLGRVGEGRRALDLVGESARDDIPDPIGRSRRFHERTAAEIEDLIDRFLAVAHPASTRTYSA